MILTVENPAASVKQPRHIVQMCERIAEACRLIESGQAVRAVHIVTSGRLKPDEVELYQTCAAHYRVQLTVDRKSMISIRPRAGEDV